VRKLGADEVIDYTLGSVEEQLKSLKLWVVEQCFCGEGGTVQLSVQVWGRLAASGHAAAF
jgi:hypothetical protein